MRPLGLRVNCTDVASARYSRWRDTAICTNLAAIGARIATTISRMMSRPPELPFLSLLLRADPTPHGRAQQHVADQRDQADRDAHDHHVARVEVGEMGHLVRHHALQLVAAQRVQQAARHHDGAVADLVCRWRRH